MKIYRLTLGFIPLLTICNDDSKYIIHVQCHV
uniref:Uncharacterized protein n=1 Tax=Rhizophora mucronata TaxID=61149 RepID=A0A2P2IZL1_RHIMU